MIISEVNARFQKGSSVLLVCHRQVKHHFKGFQTQCEYDVATWGSIAGRNDWQAYGAIFIIGLPYRDRAFDEGIFLSLQGDDDAHWNVDPDTGIDDWKVGVMNMLSLGEVTADAIQAINRVRCRRVIDSKGRCAPTAVFMLLPTDRDADYIVDTVRTEMPGIEIENWEFCGARRIVKLKSGKARIVDYADILPVGETPAPEVMKELRISPSSWKQLVRRELRDPDSPVRISLRSKGVDFAKRKNGRWYFIKD